MQNSYLKREDVILIAILLAVSVIGMIAINATKKNGAYVEIYADGAIVGSYSLADIRVVDISTDNGGSNTIVIEGQKVFMKDASCPDKVCINQGSIKDTTQSICCAPNRVIVSIVAYDTGEYDAITQ